MYLAKTLTSLAELYLDHTFPAVVYLGSDFSDVSTFMGFEVSLIAQNTKEADERKKEEKKRAKEAMKQRIMDKRNEKRMARLKRNISTPRNSEGSNNTSATTRESAPMKSPRGVKSPRDSVGVGGVTRGISPLKDKEKKTSHRTLSDHVSPLSHSPSQSSVPSQKDKDRDVFVATTRDPAKVIARKRSRSEKVGYEAEEICESYFCSASPGKSVPDIKLGATSSSSGSSEKKATDGMILLFTLE